MHRHLWVVHILLDRDIETNVTETGTGIETEIGIEIVATDWKEKDERETLKTESEIGTET